MLIIKKGKTNWLYLGAIILLAMIVGLFSILLQVNMAKESATIESMVIQRKIIKPVMEAIPLPTEIDKNFLTQVNECFIAVATVYGYSLRITSGFRTLDEQATIYELGRTVDGNIVSWAKSGESMHNYGYAVDVVDRRYGYNINWKRVAKIATFCGLNQVDDPHFEYRGGLTTEQFIAGMRPTPIAPPCDIMNKKAKAGQALTREDLEVCGAPSFW